ncbi:Uncharacterised protein [Salmonella bongori]|nr:Uncharacterised protein [Salmonella bongori]
MAAAIYLQPTTGGWGAIFGLIFLVLLLITGLGVDAAGVIVTLLGRHDVAPLFDFTPQAAQPAANADGQLRRDLP